MTRLGSLGFFLTTSTVLLGPGCGPLPAAEAEDAAHALEPASTTVFGQSLLLYLEYQPLVRGAPARFLAHLTVLASGEPVRSGTLTLEVGVSRLTVDAPKRAGLFIPEGSLPEPGTFAGKLVVKSEQAEESLDLGEITVHASAGDAEGAASSSEAAPSGAVPFLMEQQWRVKLLLAEAGERTLTTRLAVPARAVTPEGMSAVVTPPVGGRLSPPASGALPRTGERVEVGRTLALVEPPLQAPELAQLHALELEFDLKSLEVLRATGEAEARLRFAEREHERIGKLRAQELGTQHQLELAEQDLSVARTELDAAGRMRESLDRLSRNRGTSPGGGPVTALRFPIDAPIAGTIVEVRAVPGTTVETGEPVFRILDSSRLWIEGRVSELDMALVRSAPRAVGRFAALPGRQFDLRDAPYIGPEVDAPSRTLLVRYELENPDGEVRPGMLAELQIATGEHRAAVAIPGEAVVMDQGLPTAYVMLEGELFQRRDLELGAKDGAWVEVTRGVEPGERVATRGAYIVKLAALSPASFGPGHAH